MCYLSFVTQSLPASHLVSLTELKTEVHQVLHPDEAVSILVTDVENLLEPPQKLYELFLFGKGTSFHYTGFALHTHTQLIFWFSSIKRTVRHRLRRSPSPSQPSAPPDRLVPLLLYKQHGTLKRREECRKYATTYEFVTRHYVTGQLLIHNPGVLSLSSRF